MPDRRTPTGIVFGALCALVASIALVSTATDAQTPATLSAPPHSTFTRDELRAWLDGLVPAALQRHDIAGLVVSVVQDGRVVLERGYGLADVARKTPMDPTRTVVRVASLSKSFTATAAMQLVEQGKLDLDRDVNAYLDFAIPPAFGAPITLRHLLTHTAGFEEIAYQRHDPPVTLRQHVMQIPERIYAPGTIPAYSNYGLALAGYVVARVSGESFDDYMERHVLAPIGMAQSSFRMALPDALRPREAKYYALASSATPFPPTLFAQLSPTEAPASGLATTAHDMTRFMIAHLQGAHDSTPALLNEATRRRMHAPTFVPIPGAQPVALGLFRTDRRGETILGHSGDGEGVHAEMRLLVDRNVGIFIAMNSDGRSADFLPAAFTLRATLLEAFVDRFFPAPSPPQEPTLPTAAAHARLAAGEYAWSRRQSGDYQEAMALIGRFALRPIIRANADGTIETPPALSFEKEGKRQTWREVAPFVWREVGGDARLVMQVADGRVQSVWSDQSASFWTNLRVPTREAAWLHIPLLGVAALSLLLTVLLWPITAFVRRRSPAAAPLPALDARARTLSRVGALVGLLYLAGWVMAIAADLPSTVGGERWIRLIQLLGLFVIAGAGVGAWHAWRTWQGQRSLVAKAGSIWLTLALAYLAWFSFAFHLISARIN